MTPYLNAVNRMDSEENLKQQPWIMSMIQNQEGLEQSDIMNENERNILMQLKKENTVKGELIYYSITKYSLIYNLYEGIYQNKKIELYYHIIK